MEGIKPSRGPICFGTFEVDVRAGELRKHGVKVKLQEQPFQILQELLERPGELVTREELQKRIWPADTFVDFDHGLNNAVKRLREALSDSAETPRFIETLPRRGYRFIGPVNGTTSVGSVPRTLPRRWPFRTLTIPAGVVLLLVVLLSLNVGNLRGRLLGRSGAPPIRSLAVLPLQNLSGDPSQDYFADGMTDALITELSQISTLKVISRTSVMRYKKTDKAVAQIARELGVDGLIEGTVQRSGDRVRITAQLIYAPADKHLWAKGYERDVGDVLNLESELARAIVGEIEVKLTPQESQRLSRRHPVNPKALEAYVQGKYYLNKADELEWVSGAVESRNEDLEMAHRLFMQAIQEDPSYAPPYVGLAEIAAPQGYPVRKDRAKTDAEARAALQKALELDPGLAEAHQALAHLLYHSNWNWSAAEKEYRRALELNPNFAHAHADYADYLDAMGRQEEGMREFLRVEELDPGHEWVPNTYYRRRQYSQAIELYQNDIKRHAFGAFPYWDLGQAYAAAGSHNEAANAWQQMMRMFGSTDIANAMQSALVSGGWKAAYHTWVRWLEDDASRGEPIPTALPAKIYGLLGEKERAFEWLEKAYEQHDYDMTDLNSDPIWDPIRSDPRFKDLVRRVGLPP